VHMHGSVREPVYFSSYPVVIAATPSGTVPPGGPCLIFHV
jgi:hypothetical protein